MECRETRSDTPGTNQVNSLTPMGVAEKLAIVRSDDRSPEPYKTSKCWYYKSKHFFDHLRGRKIFEILTGGVATPFAVSRRDFAQPPAIICDPSGMKAFPPFG